MAGGDDSIVDPRCRGRASCRRPALKALTVRVVPRPTPACARQTLAPGLTQLRALEGTRLELDAEANKPLASAELRIGDEPAGTAVAFDASRTRLQDGDRRQGSSFSFWFRMKDTEGFANREEVRFDVRSFRDEAPRVVIEEPKTDRDVPADATVPVQIARRRRFRHPLGPVDLQDRHRRLRAARGAVPSRLVGQATRTGPGRRRRWRSIRS